MLQRHRPFSSALQQKHGKAARCSARQLRHGCSRPAAGACRRRLAIVAALDGWAQPATVGSSDNAATAEKQQQQLQPPLQQPSSSTPASGSTQQQLQQQLDADTNSANGSAGSSSSTSLHPQEQQQQQQQLTPSWESWCAHFEQQDLQGTRLDALAAPLAAAVAAEDYAAAAAIKAEADALIAADAVAAVQRDLAAALSQERYGDAAELRDKGWALLEGWWACVSPQHPLGHLLRVYSEYGRWTGKVLRAAEVWELQGWPDGEWGHLLGRTSSSSSSSRAQGAAGRRPRSSSSSSSSSSKGSTPGIEPEAMAQIGTPLLEVFVKREQQQQQQHWSSQAVLLQPASSDAADAAAVAAAARDIGLEAAIGELFRAEVARAVWGRSAVGGDAAAAAAASLANGRRSSSSSSNTGKERLKPLLRGSRSAAAAAARDSSPLSPFAAAAAGASYESLFADVAAEAAASQDEGTDDVAAFAAAAAVGGDAADAHAAAAAAAAVAAASELEPWEELLDAAEPVLAAAAAAADAEGGFTCADGATRLLQRRGSSAAAQLQLPVLQLLLEVVDGSSSVLLAARAVSPATIAPRTAHGTAWVVGDMPPGPAFVADWSGVPSAEVEARQARLAASLEAQRIVRDMLGAKEGWWMTEFMGSWSPPPAAAADPPRQQQQQQQQDDSSDVDWQLPLQLLQQQQDLQQQQQQQQLGDMTLLEETSEEEEGSWPVLGDAVSREGFYAGFYQDYGPGVQGPAGLVQPSASAAYTGFEQQAAAAAAGGSGGQAGVYGLGLALPSDMAPAELDEALQTLAELKSLSDPDSSSKVAANGNDEPPIAWRTPANSQQPQQQQDPTQQQQQQQASRGSRRHTSGQAAGGSSSSSNDSSGGSWTPATWLSPGPAGVAAAAADGEDLERHQATITILGRDKFTIKPTQPLWDSAAGSGKPTTSSSSSSPRRSVFVIEVPTCLLQQQQQGGASSAAADVSEPPPASSLSISSRGYSRVWQLAAQQLLLQHAATASGGSSSSSNTAATPTAPAAAAASQNANFSSGSSGPLPITWRQPLADLMAARAEEVLWGSSAVAVAASALSTLEEDAAAGAADGMVDRHRSSCSLSVAEDAPLLVLQLPGDLVESTLAAVAGSSSSEGAAAGQRQAGGAAAAAAAAGGVGPDEGLTYRRIYTKHHPSDELQGLFLGTFGPHGPEVLSLSRSISLDSGEEELVALKLTGDPNVPAGEVSFRVRIGRRHRRDGKGVYPPQLDVKVRYPGEGRIASPGYTNKRWVEGELLVFGGGSSSSSSGSVTNGAQLGFVWSVPGEKRFLILLNRISLDT